MYKVTNKLSFFGFSHANSVLVSTSLQIHTELRETPFRIFLPNMIFYAFWQPPLLYGDEQTIMSRFCLRRTKCPLVLLRYMQYSEMQSFGIFSNILFYVF
jgi:hypothetical protein